MREVAIVGAGELGGLIAYALARRNAARAVWLIDDEGSIAKGKALDIGQAAPLEPFAATVSGSADIAAAAGAHIVVIADAARGAAWTGDEALAVLRRVSQYAPHAIVLCAAANHGELVDRGVRELRMARRRLLGSAPAALAAAASAMVALEFDGSPRDVSIAVVGVPPARIVIGWEHAALAGLSVAERLTEPRRRHLTRRIEALWPPGLYTLAQAAVKVIEIIAGQSRQLPVCFVAPDETAVAKFRTAAMPVRLDWTGIVEVVSPPLTAVEQVALDNAVRL